MAKQMPTSMNHLVYGEGLKHQQGRNRGQILFPMPVVMLKVVALILERVESFVLDLPPRSTSAHRGLDRARIKRDVCNPGPTTDVPLPVGLLVKQIVDLHIDRALTQAEVIGPGKVMLCSFSRARNG